MKVCKECKGELDFNCFSRNKNLKDGYENKCKKCRNKARLKYENICLTCGKVWKSQKPNAKYCSQACKPQSERKRSVVKCAYCGKEKETLTSKVEKFENHFCDIVCKNRYYGKTHKGSNSPRYNVELTEKERIVGRKYTEYYNWRKEVYERDKYTCQCCGDNKGGNLVAHHILNYSSNKELRTTLSNGITLCSACHDKFHKIYGNKNNNEKQLKEFLK